jgi:2-polyprenyl-6-methoxyphenol hydroxylase-like FAD-dependent oxidoreductase
MIWSADQPNRFSGSQGCERFLGAFDLESVPGSGELAGAEPAGPCAAFPMNDTWCDEPFVDGCVLIGDAAGYSDPIIGQGLSVSLRDAREVAEVLTCSSDWSAAAFRDYGAGRAERMRRLRVSSSFITDLRCTFTAEGRERRRRVFDRWAADPAEKALIAAVLVGPENLPEEVFAPGAVEWFLR